MERDGKETREEKCGTRRVSERKGNMKVVKGEGMGKKGEGKGREGSAVDNKGVEKGR